MSPADPLSTAAWLAGVLEKLGIRYLVGGSVASSIWGEPRSTMDLDVMIDADLDAVTRLVTSLEDEFYVDQNDARAAVAHRSSFNAIHLGSSLKIDFFVAHDAQLERNQFERRRPVALPAGTVDFYAPEDLIVRKLIWFRDGNEQSDRQWRDVLGILRVSGHRIDHTYLHRAALQAGVAKLLERAFARLSELD